jgi:hypothetical protein
MSHRRLKSYAKPLPSCKVQDARRQILIPSFIVVAKTLDFSLDSGDSSRTL